MAAIGIDLGTTFSGATAYRDGHLINIPTPEWKDIMPSVVGFRQDGPPLCGQDAVEQMAFNPKNTLFDVKRLIGRVPSDQTINAESNNWPFHVINDEGCIKLSVVDQGEQRNYLPEEVSAILLRTLKQLAQDKLQQEVTSAVVTVPAYFDAQQRSATLQACRLADLGMCTLISEPTAAAIALGFSGKSIQGTLLVYDLGGGTFDISIIKVEGRMFDVISTDGDTHLGGRDFDNRLVDHVRAKFEKQYKCCLREDYHALTRLRAECENAKLCLSDAQYVLIQLKRFHSTHDLCKVITRAEFEHLSADLFQRTIEITRRALNNAKLQPKQIKSVLLVGGCTRIPKIRELLNELFSSNQLIHAYHPDLAVMHGAALYAAKRARISNEQFDSFSLSDIHPFAIGIGDHEDKMIPLIPSNVKIPFSATHRVTTSLHNQTSMTIRVYEGNDSSIQNNRLLGRFQLSRIAKAPAGKPFILVEVRINENGILKVTATEKYGAGAQNSLEIGNLRQINVKDELKEESTSVSTQRMQICHESGNII